MRRLAFFILSLGILYGCGQLDYIRYLPREDTEWRIHPSLGMIIYNKSGELLDEKRWIMIFLVTNAGFDSFKRCVGVMDRDIEEQLKNSPVVMIGSDRSRFPGDSDAFTDFERIFIRQEYYDEGSLIVEWLHIYFWLSGQHLFGDYSHSDPLFKKCKNFR